MSYLHEKTDYKDVIREILNKTFPSMFTRPMFTFIKDAQKNGIISKDIIIVEVGTDLGMNAKNIKHLLSFKVLHLVDPYFDNYRSYDSGDERFNKAVEYVGDGDNINFIRATSEAASKRFRSNGIDCVYIDGNHKYDYVLQDIKLWYPKVKKGGIIGGHDFFGSGLDVILAITDYVNKNNIRDKLYGFGTDWWIVK